MNDISYTEQYCWVLLGRGTFGGGNGGYRRKRKENMKQVRVYCIVDDIQIGINMFYSQLEGHATHTHTPSKE